MRVLFCAFDSPGHLFPLVGLALEMRRRGHAVAFATGLPAAATLEAVGLERIPRGEREGPSFRLNTHHAALSVQIDTAHAEWAARRFRPDVVVTHQLCYAPLMLRERMGVPVAVMGLFSYLWPHAPSFGPPRAGEVDLEPVRHWRLGSDLGTLNAAREALRLPPLAADPADVPFLADLFMLRTAPELEPDLARLPPQVHAAGACLWEPPRDEAAEWEALRADFIRPDAPLLYVQHGRTFGGPGFWAQLTEALAEVDVQVVASVGRMDQEVTAAPPSFVVRGHVPQGLVLPRAAAVVSGGHSSAVLATLAHGLPGVVVPSGAETPDNAEKLAEAGCVLRLWPESLTAEEMRGAVEATLAGGELARCSRWAGAALARMDGFGRAVELVERLGDTGARVDRETEEAPAALAGAAA
jgi:UDP:flavonoid glycosyltransferase YjiC (YdhE family)